MFKPSLVINVGTCGGWKKQGGEIAKIYIPRTMLISLRRLLLPDREETSKWTEHWRDTLQNHDREAKLDEFRVIITDHSHH